MNDRHHATIASPGHSRHDNCRTAKSDRRCRPIGLNNGRVESVNAKIRLIQIRAFGFHNPYALIALAKLTLSRRAKFRRLPSLPARTTLRGRPSGT